MPSIRRPRVTPRLSEERQRQALVSSRLAHLAEQFAAGRDAADAADTAGTELPAAAGEEWWREHTRVAQARAPLHAVPDVPEPAPEPAPAAPTLPGRDRLGAEVPMPRAPAPAPVRVREPGRHAARRRISAAALVPETLRGRVRISPAGLGVVALLVAVALSITAWQVIRDDPDPPVPVTGPSGEQPPVVAAPQSEMASAAPSSTSPDATGPSGKTVTVDVAGKVRRPGIVVLASGARVVDALEKAGGARPSVDLSSLNLARVLVDGEQIVVGIGASPDPASPLPGSSSTTGAPGSTAPAALVDLNLADQALLETLPDVGPVTAAAIIAWREEHGGFTAVTELLEVSGIGEATLATLTPLVTV
ncbi:ComEA family DNA-binding protein [Nocardioides sp. GXZ039]|uniref:ComEA family DNA-binding protein n=1 Tax=Nocardioides sp. GXZ039 TaxID=3136018 RepID=UPI0030F45B2A